MMVNFKRFLFLQSCMLSILWPELIGVSSSSRGLTSSMSPPVTREEKLNDFLEWVGRVGSKNHSTGNTPAGFGMSKIVAGVITVDKSGSGDFTTVQAAVNSVPTKNNQRVVIQIAAGDYEEKVNVPKNKPYITFQGAGSGLTSITWHDTASSSGSTQDSASVAINSNNFIARDITFKNSAPAPSGGESGKQAVALRVSGDEAAFYSCNMLGAQDTLYDDVGKHYFENCFIQGSIDFICGDGQSLYKGCQLHALPISEGSLTAQKRSSPGENTGFSFVDCTVTGSGTLYLGRAWGPYARTVFSYTSMADIIIPAGWYNWGDSSRDNKVLYGQYKCTGPGANENGRVAWAKELTDAQAAPFQSLSFIDGASWVEA